MALETGRKALVICHAVRGRLRVRFVSLRWSEGRASLGAQWLLKQPAIEEASVRSLTGSIIIRYNPHKSDQEAILALVQGLPAQVWTHADRPDPVPARAHAAVTSEPGTRDRFSFGWRLLWVIGFTAFACYGLIRKLILKSPLAEGMFSASGLAAAVGTIPMLRHGVSDLLHARGLGLYLFLGGASLVAIVAGQATAALEVVWVTSLSMLIEDYVTDKSRRAIHESLAWQIKNVSVVIDGEEREIPLSQVKKADAVSVHSGERIPVDGVVAYGEALVDEAHLTGRAEPELRTTGDFVYAGTLATFGYLRIIAENVGEETYLRRMLHRAEEALEHRAPAERRADILARRLTLLGSAATLGTLLFTAQLSRVLTVLLVAACPCATALAASTAITAAIANAAKRRVFIKGGLYLEGIGTVDCFCFDKTGTLTIERSTVDEIVDLEPAPDENRILALALAAEIHNPHPIARAIVDTAQKAGITITAPTGAEVALGRGVSVRMGDDVLVVGNAHLMRDRGIDTATAEEHMGRFQARGRTVVYVARNGTLEGLITVSNEVRPGARSLVKALKKDGVREMHLVTGDLEPVAEALSLDLDLDGHGASLLPDAKARYIEKLKERGLHVAMVGDGMNDALALSAADIGIAMGAGGSEVALEAGDIALVESDLTRLLMLRRLSRKSLRVVEQNHWFAVSTNLVGMALGAMGAMGPVVAGLIHIMHTLGIMVNSSRLMRWDDGRTSDIDQDTAPVGLEVARQTSLP